MFKSGLLVSTFFCLATLPAIAQEAPPLGNDKDRTSYAIGVAFGRSLIQQGKTELNYDLVVKGGRVKGKFPSMVRIQTRSAALFGCESHKLCYLYI